MRELILVLRSIAFLEPVGDGSYRTGSFRTGGPYWQKLRLLCHALLFIAWERWQSWRSKSPTVSLPQSKEQGFVNKEEVALEEVLKTAQDYIDALNSLLSIHCGGTHCTEQQAAGEVTKTHLKWREFAVGIFQ